MIKKILFLIIIAVLTGCVEVDGSAFSNVKREGGKIYIIDRKGYKWDVTQAESVGFKPERFHFGLGKNAFIPLDDTFLSDDNANAPQDLRIIGVEDATYSKAYSVTRLSPHEISNSTLGDKPIAVGY
jgi:hypothetical protein